MSGKVISGYVNSTVTLDSTLYFNTATIANSGTVIVSSGYGVTANSAGTLINFGTISADSDEGVSLYNGGSVTNWGTIYGRFGGIYQYTDTEVVNNYGTIIGGAGVKFSGFTNAGIYLVQGTITNHGNALISGSSFGVYALKPSIVVNDGGTIAGAGVGVNLDDGFGSTGTVVNSGTIIGAIAAVEFKKGNADLIVGAGGKFIGAVSAAVSPGDQNVIELTAGASAGLLDMGGSFTGFGTIEIDTGAQWTLDGTSAELAGGQSIVGFNVGDTLGLTDFNATSKIYDDSSGQLTLAGTLTVLGVGTVTSEIMTFAAGTGLTTANFNFTPDGSGTDITLCFYPGTRIATPAGEVAVEDLRTGDLVVTANGAKPVRWIGQSTVSLRFADRLRTLPVRIRAGALGDVLPRRDLLVSPDHALFLGGILVQAGALVDGVNILREYDVPEQFTYYHVELESHELLLAEGAWTESFVDNVARMHFQNWDERETPATPIVEMEFPRAKSARQVPLALRAGKVA